MSRPIKFSNNRILPSKPPVSDPLKSKSTGSQRQRGSNHGGVSDSSGSSNTSHHRLFGPNPPLSPRSGRKSRENMPSPSVTRRGSSPTPIRRSKSSDCFDNTINKPLESKGPKISSYKTTDKASHTHATTYNAAFPAPTTQSQSRTPQFGRRSSSPNLKESDPLNIDDSSFLSYASSGHKHGSPSPITPVNSSGDKRNTNFNNSNEDPPPYQNPLLATSERHLESHKLKSSYSPQISRKSPATVGIATSSGTAGIGGYHTSDRYYGTTSHATSDRHYSSTSPVRSHTSITRISNQGLVGLRNLGNTCYMNSILQCLSATECLTKLLLDGEDKSLERAKNNGIVKSYLDLLNQMWASITTNSSVAPTSFKQKINRLAPLFQGYDQHDSQEFLRFLVSGLHDELNKARTSDHPPPPTVLSPTLHTVSDQDKADYAWDRSLAFDNSVISDIFMGQLKSTLTCLTCGHISVTFDPFWDLSLPIPRPPGSSVRSIYQTDTRTNMDVSLSDCFKLFTAKENLDRDDKPLCENCKTLQPATKQLSIQRYPDVLVIHLKRFSGVHYRTKLSTPVKFKEEISLISSEGHETQYQLYAISNHSGSCYGGHYTAFCKHSIQGKWYQFNDSSVAPVSTPSIVSPQAYVLFYRKVVPSKL